MCTLSTELDPEKELGSSYVQNKVCAAHLYFLIIASGEIAMRYAWIALKQRRGNLTGPVWKWVGVKGSHLNSSCLSG